MYTYVLKVFPEDQTPFPVYMMYPPFAFYRILQYLNLGCLSMQCYSTDTLSPAGGLNVVTTALLYLGFSTIGLMFVSIYLSFVLPSEYGVRKSPFFPIIGKLEKRKRSTLCTLLILHCFSVATLTYTTCLCSLLFFPR